MNFDIRGNRLIGIFITVLFDSDWSEW